MFFCFTVFVLLFLVINYKWGVVATPVLQYGMYSGKYHLADSITFYQLTVNGKSLDAYLLPQGENDKLQSYLNQYAVYKENNKVTYHIMSTYFGRLGLISFATQHKYNIEVPVPEHYNWLKNKIEQAVDEPVHEFTAARQLFTWKGAALQPAYPAVKILFVGPK